eukprot:189838-Chlamydomonas_euryale.AAC.14
MRCGWGAEVGFRGCRMPAHSTSSVWSGGGGGGGAGTKSIGGQVRADCTSANRMPGQGQASWQSKCACEAALVHRGGQDRSELFRASQSA